MNCLSEVQILRRLGLSRLDSGRDSDHIQDGSSLIFYIFNNKLYFTKSSIKAKQLCSLIVNGMLNDESIQIDRLEKLASDAKLELNDIRACVALVEFILKTSAKHSTSSDTLSSELQQLGLPKGTKHVQ